MTQVYSLPFFAHILAGNIGGNWLNMAIALNCSSDNILLDNSKGSNNLQVCHLWRVIQSHSEWLLRVHSQEHFLLLCAVASYTHRCIYCV